MAVRVSSVAANGAWAADANTPDEDDLILSLDVFVRSVGIRRTTPHTLFLGAGASVSSGIPSAESCIWEWKRALFLTNNPGLEYQFTELSLSNVQHQIQQWLDKQGTSPGWAQPRNTGSTSNSATPDRRAYFQEKVRSAQPYIGYRLLCHVA